MMGNRKLQIQGSNHTLSLNDGQQKIQSNSCDDLVSEWEVSVLSQQNPPNPASVPVTWKVNSVISKNKAKWKILKTTKRLEKKGDKQAFFIGKLYIHCKYWTYNHTLLALTKWGRVIWARAHWHQKIMTKSKGHCYDKNKL